MAKPTVYKVKAIGADNAKSKQTLRLRQYDLTEVPKQFVVRVDEITDEDSGEVIGFNVNNSNFDLRSKNQTDWFIEHFEGFRRKAEDGTILMLVELHAETGLETKDVKGLEFF